MSDELRERWRSDEPVFGGWCMLPSAHGAELLAAGGLDYVCVDCQHGLISADAMFAMLQAMSGLPVTPFVRVLANDPGQIGWALDAGAHGVIVPLVNTPEEAARAVAACRYPPDGIRSLAVVRPRQALTGPPEEVNRRVLCFPMIETRDGIERCEEICRVPGVDGAYVGPSDLAVSLGVPLHERSRSPEHREAIEWVRRACEDAGIVPGIHAGSGEAGRAYAAEGFRLLTVAVDARLFVGGVSRELRAARASGEA